MAIEKAKPEIWTGRASGQQLYMHEKVSCVDEVTDFDKAIAVLGYANDEGVLRNQGRVGAVNGADAIRKQLGKMPNHLSVDTHFYDMGNVQCLDGDMEHSQTVLAKKVTQLLAKNAFPILLGGGHDIAYGHYNGIKNFLPENKTIGIINFDAHFDLRSNENGNNSGTPFFQIAQDCKQQSRDFKYCCLGIRKDANDKVLFETARSLGVVYVENRQFAMEHTKNMVEQLLSFLANVDYVYTTIDLDGFSSAYAPGVSAPSPMGFSPDIVVKALEVIIASKKLISLDIAEMNPVYDIDNHTSKLAASLIHFLAHRC